MLTSKDVKEIRLVDDNNTAIPIRLAGADNADGNAWMITLNMEKDFEGVLSLEIRGEDGELHAFRASWDEKAKAFVFDSDQLGEFVLVYMEDWPEELLFKNDFYAALEEIMKQQLPVKGTEI